MIGTRGISSDEADQSEQADPQVAVGSAAISASLWPRIADLPLVIEGSESGRLEPGEEFGEAHANRLVRLIGGGEEGSGEDITLLMSEAPALALEGEWTIGSFCQHLATIEQWAEPPEWEMAAVGATGPSSRPRSTSLCARPGRHCTRCSGSSRDRVVKAFPDVPRHLPGRRHIPGSATIAACELLNPSQA